jgi:probable H4MPT-linked C1 transfer pathway protein
MAWLALDIGGANIKAADGRGFAAAYPFPLWRRHAELSHELRRVISEGPACDHVVATMTGELADCFESKEEGVKWISEALQQAVDGRHTRVYLNDGSLVTPVVATRRHQEAAASNWHALARFAGRFLEFGPALLLDVGSTTCDVIAFRDGFPIHVGRNDTQRMISGELVYSGVQRTPVCGICRTVPYRDQFCPLALEFFSTMVDVYVILGDLPEDSASHYTADGRSATKGCARARLARSICADAELFNHRDAIVMSQALAEAQVEQLITAMERVVGRLAGPPRSVVITGHGEFLAKRALENLGWEPVVISLRQQLGALVSRCATAHALAVIANETSGA